MDFGEIVMKSFDLALSGETLITVLKAAANVPLNAFMVAEDQILEKLMESLTKVLALLQKRESWKAVDPML